MKKNIKPDICLFQEYTEIIDKNRPNDFQIIHKFVDDTKYWDTVIATKNLSIKDINFQDYPGRALISEINLKNGKNICIINIHAIPIGTDMENYTRWVQKVLDSIAHIIANYKGRLIIGGNLNTDPAFDKRPWTNNKDVIERIESFGLIKHPKTGEIKTYRHRKDLSHQWIDDYMFVSKEIEIKSLDILYDNEVKKLSDHNPVVITLDL